MNPSRPVPIKHTKSKFIHLTFDEVRFTRVNGKEVSSGVDEILT